MVEALRGSKELLEVNGEGTHVRRRVELVKPSEDGWKEINDRTVYAVFPPRAERTVDWLRFVVGANL